MKKLRTFFVWLLLIVLIVWLLQSSGRPVETVSFAEFLAFADELAVERVNVWGNELTFTLRDGRKFQTLGVLDPDLRADLSHQDVRVTDGAPRDDAFTIMMWLLPVVFVVLFVWLLLRRSQGGMGNVLELLRSRHREVAGEQVGVSFADVGGCEEAKAQLRDLVEFLRDPQPWLDAGARLPRGLLLEGPPGCGKTLLARAVAGETRAKFFLVTGSEFVEMFVGVGAARVRDLFESAAKQAPAVVFIDELDALGRRRGSGIGGSHDEREQTLNQLLVCLDGFRPLDRVVVIAATNRVDVLDQALLRPGRFDRRVRVPLLSESARAEVLAIHTRNKPLRGDVNLREIARRTASATGAQLENLANEAALAAVRRSLAERNGPAEISQSDLLAAVEQNSQREQRFDQVDAVLIESASQLSEPTGCARVRLTLRDGPPVEGEVVWADSSFLKIRRAEDGGSVLIPKRQVLHIEALTGTSTADDFALDAWAAHKPGLA